MRKLTGVVFDQVAQAVTHLVVERQYLERLVRQMLARRSSGDVSARLLASYAGGYAIWLAYGLSTRSLPLIVADTVGLLCGGLTLAVALSLRGSSTRPATWNSRT